jgi:integrase
MPRASKGARLWLRPARRKGGRVIANAVWIIIDGSRHVATGCAKGEAREAEQKLAAYIADKYQPTRSARDIEQIDVADVLSIYLDDCGPRITDQAKLARTIGRLNEFWGGKMLARVNTAECRAYVASRGKVGGARADLETLRAAINHHAKEGLHHGIVRVALPQKGQPRDRWLTRDEAAALIWACWRYRERQSAHRGRHKGHFIETDKRPLRHLARFILIGLYTGTRASAIAAASPYREAGHSFVDLDQGIYYRLAIGRRATKKRQTPAPIPPRLLAHMRRWVRLGIVTSHFVEWHGAPIKSVKTGFRHAVALAQLWGKVTPHTLRHTAATWLMQRGVPIWQAAGYLGMSAQMIERTYGHHHPDFMRGAAAAITTKQPTNISGQPKNVSLVIPLVEPENGRSPKRKIQ